MRIEIRPQIRVKKDGRIQVIIWRHYFESVDGGKLLHHREALARANYWFVVAEGSDVPEGAIFDLRELAVEQAEDYRPCNIFQGSTVWSVLMGEDEEVDDASD